MLYQAGYLTVDKLEHYEEYDIYEYKLRVPNKEVQISLNNLIIEYLTDKYINPREKITLLEILKYAKLDDFKEYLESLFASIPYNNYVKNTISSFEGYYASVIYAYLASLGLKLIAEDVTNRGRLDLTIFMGDNIYCIEFKVDGSDALNQIKEREYYKKYLNDTKEIYLVGIEFDSKDRNISHFEWEKIK